MDIFLILIIAVSLAFLLNLNMLVQAFREKKIAEYNLEISRVASKLERKLLAGEHTIGETCHDLLPKLVAYAQFKGQSIPLRVIPSDRDKLVIRKLDREYAVEESIDKDLMNDFTDAILRAFVVKQPILIFVLACLVVGYYFLMALLKLTWVGWSYMQKRTAEWIMAIIYNETISPVRLSRT